MAGFNVFFYCRSLDVLTVNNLDRMMRSDLTAPFYAFANKSEKCLICSNLETSVNSNKNYDGIPSIKKVIYKDKFVRLEELLIV